MTTPMIETNTMSQKDTKSIEIQNQLNECVICLNYMVEPCSLKPHCTHKFCISCLEDHFELNGRNCPLCRQTIPYNFELKIDQDDQMLFKNNDEKLYNQIEKELKLEGRLHQNEKIEITVGHELIYKDKVFKGSLIDNFVSKQRKSDLQKIDLYIQMKDKLFNNFLIDHVQFILKHAYEKEICIQSVKKPSDFNQNQEDIYTFFEINQRIKEVMKDDGDSYSCSKCFKAEVRVFFKANLIPFQARKGPVKELDLYYLSLPYDFCVDTQKTGNEKYEIFLSKEDYQKQVINEKEKIVRQEQEKNKFRQLQRLKDYKFSLKLQEQKDSILLNKSNNTEFNEVFQQQKINIYQKIEKTKNIMQLTSIPNSPSRVQQQLSSTLYGNQSFSSSLQKTCFSPSLQRTLPIVEVHTNQRNPDNLQIQGSFQNWRRQQAKRQLTTINMSD